MFGADQSFKVNQNIGSMFQSLNFIVFFGQNMFDKIGVVFRRKSPPNYGVMAKKKGQTAPTVAYSDW